MLIDKRTLCLQGVVKKVSRPFNNGTQVEIKMELGSAQRVYSGELVVRIPVDDSPLFEVGMRYSVPVICQWG